MQPNSNDELFPSHTESKSSVLFVRVGHACNLSAWEVESGQELKTVLGYILSSKSAWAT